MKASLPSLHGMSVCGLVLFLPAPDPALAEGLAVHSPPVSLASAAGAAPALTGEEAVAHLKESGEYESLSAALSAARHAVRAVEDAPGEAWTANSAHGLNSTFDADGLRLTVRTAEEKTFTTRWRLTGLGRDGAATAVVAAGELRHAGTRAEIDRPALGLTEWFANSALGLEHGFTLATRPDGAADAPLRLTLAVTGDLAPVAVRDGQALALRDAETGATVLDYAGLKAWDARGQAIAARMISDAASGTVTFAVADAGAAYPLTIDPTFTQQAYLKASNADERDVFGSSVAVSGDTVVVGALLENGNMAGDEGAAYVFVRSGSAWSQQGYLKASNPTSQDVFGESVSISGDTVIIGAPAEDGDAASTAAAPNNNLSAAGAAYVFVRSGSAWSQQAYLKASNPVELGYFGNSVAVSGDTVVIGAHGERGDAASTVAAPNNLAFRAGAAYVFVRSGTTWNQQAYLKASNAAANDHFGFSVALSGDTAVVGASQEDGDAASTAAVPNENAEDAGAAYIFVRSGAAWSQQAYLKASNDEVGDGLENDGFGYSVAVSGDTAVVGAYKEDGDAASTVAAPNENAGDAGAGYVFVRSGAAWSQQAYLKASNAAPLDWFGNSVAVSGDTIVFGVYAEDGDLASTAAAPNDNANLAGAAYVFVRSGVSWSQEAYLKASNADTGDLFGSSVAVSGETVVVGAEHEFGDAASTAASPNDNAITAGAAYVFLIEDTGLSDAYTVWIDNYPAIPPALRAPDADAEGDGLPNGIEFFCGLAPDADSNSVATDPAAANRPTFVEQGGLFGLRLTRSDANLALGSGIDLAPALQIFTESGGWTTTAIDPGAGPVLEYLVVPAADASLARFTVTFP